jgi:NitT/TauT family transport system substrate-binding protein
VRLFELKSAPAVVEAVKSGEVDAGLVWGPFDQNAEAKGYTVVLNSSDLYPGHPCCRLVIQTGALNARGDVWPRLIRALLKAERFSQSEDPEHRRRTVEDIAKYLKLDKESIEKGYYHGQLDQTSDPNVRGVENFWSIMQELDVIHSNDEISRFFDLGPFRDALDSLLREEPDDPYWLKTLALFESRNGDVPGGGRSNQHWQGGKK